MIAQGRIPGWLAGIIGGVGIVLAWWLFSVVAFRPDEGTSFTPVPSPWAVFHRLFEDGLGAYWPAFEVTLTEAGYGFVWGNGLALLLASTVLLVPRLEPVIVQVAVVSYCLPMVAVGGIAIVAVGGADQPGDPSKTAILLAALAVFFTTVVGALLGFRAADRASLDVVSVYGGGRLTQLRKVRLVAALPAILNALQVAVPTAFLGAVLGEYMGATDRSVGILLIRLQGNLDSERVWVVFLLCALIALVGYGLVGLLARFVTPWVSGRES
ncbi:MULTISPECIES: ABC transporter permease [Nocardioides]|uniref:ABC-type nitrate/sulfonate/bicarbonate transport system, permease component n=1 Tax=Nocardioides lianchengensis TaxID=1045774 RepID=A0A1G6V0Y1_9ACTN|nr:ABC transporter permease subunit [Nocardioides lianchengensis]NYG11098.1 ABC-type nitrate/sulfonate/bicarbonate transport system permease component [Nocardioides lianchengensis]SDD47124.1 ABC-type nitrate/sulfonate/bicarbonate transport system, permease component [Nocardioides lianchengensis]